MLEVQHKLYCWKPTYDQLNNLIQSCWIQIRYPKSLTVTKNLQESRKFSCCFFSDYRVFPVPPDWNGHRIWILQVKIHDLKKYPIFSWSKKNHKYIYLFVYMGSKLLLMQVSLNSRWAIRAVNFIYFHIFYIGA